MLYPIKFKPILKEKIWGGSFLCEKEVEEYRLRDGIGESWEISGLEENLSVVSNGKLMGNSIQELLEVYMGDIVGDSIYQKNGVVFPFLLKIIDTTDILSVQVHPNDILAKERHEASGKNEFSYIMDCCEGAYMYIGLKKGITQEVYLEAVKNNKVEEILNKVEVKKGDAFNVPAGVVHAIGAGILLVEVQQPSDLTYRIFDWNRKDSKDKFRELHTQLAVDAIDYGYNFDKSIRVESKINEYKDIFSSEYFKIGQINLEGEFEHILEPRDSFTAYMCVDGVAYVESYGVIETLDYGEVVLIPNEIDSVKICGKGKILDFHM
ncbi:MAG: class I mannose-6-phosphate isomerase [Bacteroidetes bacterium]|nr:class I mannose-6-phosphate isomerase [Bacteroidota bacterium]